MPAPTDAVRLHGGLLLIALVMLAGCNAPAQPEPVPGATPPAAPALQRALISEDGTTEMMVCVGVGGLCYPVHYEGGENYYMPVEPSGIPSAIDVTLTWVPQGPHMEKLRLGLQCEMPRTEGEPWFSYSVPNVIGPSPLRLSSEAIEWDPTCAPVLLVWTAPVVAQPLGPAGVAAFASTHQAWELAGWVDVVPA